MEHYSVTDSRQTVGAELRFNTFEVLMQQVDAGKLTFEEAVNQYKQREVLPGVIDTALQA